MKKKYTLKIYPVGARRQVYRVIEISGEHSLDDLCEVILSAFDFTDEHLYEFCMDNRKYSDYSYQSVPQYNEPSTRVKLDEIGLEPKQKFSLHYDFGDDWMFTIVVQNITETSEKVVPNVIKEKEMIEQYPEWDDDEYDYE